MTTLTDLNCPYSPCEVKKVQQINLGIFDPEHIRALSVCEVVETELYDNGAPKAMGLNDPLMGTTDYRVPCQTCHMDCRTCPGHFGHVNLVKPVFNIGFLPAVLCILRCVCYSCGRLLASPDDPRTIQALKIKNSRTRLSKLLAICRTKQTCEPGSGQMDGEEVRTDGCGCAQPKYRKDNVNILVDFGASAMGAEAPVYDAGGDGGDTKRVFSAEEVLNVFNRISEHDMKLMGFDVTCARPSWLIIQSFLIIPPCVRPYVQFGSDRSEDDLTLKLLDIVKLNKQIQKYEQDGVAQHVIQEAVTVLQYHVATFMNNEIPGLPTATTKSKKPMKSIRERLKGKEGRLRGNLMGKRVDFSARTVITGDPNLAIDQVGMPRSIAMNLTYPEVVTVMNMESLKKAVANGPSIWPGARYITRTDGTRFDLRHCAGNPAVLQLEPGYKVERHVRDGDYILFNRQPSLHKMSIMGHRVKVLPWSTFRCNLSVTAPYNADFDGDEMNVHLAQSQETRAEIKHLCLVSRQIVSPQGNRPVMGIVQDSLMGLAKMTSRNTFIARDLMMTICLWIPDWDGVLPEPIIYRPKTLWTGKQVVTMILKAGIGKGTNVAGGISGATTGHYITLHRDGAIKLKNDSNNMSVNDGHVIIRNSEHLAGIICKRTAGTSSGSLIHVLWHQCGAEKTKDVLSALQKTVNNWLLTQGFTVGVADIVAPRATAKKVEDSLAEAYGKVDELIKLARNGTLETQPGKSLLESFENRVNSELNQARESSGKIAAENLTSTNNNIIAMVNSGSKGSTINISQIMACVGQQNVEGKRIPFGFQDRALPHFLKFDYGPDSRGFVYNSYLSGLRPHELFFHAMGGREGIIDTACKTSETGYIQRRLVKAMEDVLVTYDRTVRNSNGEVIQFLYGEDGMSGEFIEDQFLDLLKLDYEKIEQTYKHDFRSPTYGQGWLKEKSMRDDLMYSVEKQTVLINEWQQLIQAHKRLAMEIFPDGEAKQHLPVNLARLIQIAKSKFGDEDMTTVNPIEIIQAVDSVIANDLMIFSGGGGGGNSTKFNTSRNVGRSIFKEAQMNATTLFAIHCRTNLNSRKLIEKDKVGPLGLDWLFKQIGRLFQKSLCAPGEVVGALAAQSIGEPATQMTLNTFHFAGVGSKNVTLGVPRLRELINVAKQVKTPSLTVYLKDPAARDSTLAKEVQSKLEYSTLEKVVGAVQLAYDPDPMNTIVSRDRRWVTDFYEFPGEEEQDLTRLGRWVVRVQLLERLITEGMTMRDIGTRIVNEFKSDELDVIWTDDNNEELVLRVRIKHSPAWQVNDMKRGSDPSTGDETEDELRFLQAFTHHGLSSLAIRGIPGILKVYMREEKSPQFDPATGKFPLTGGRWVLDTDGCNLAQVLCIEEVEFERTTSNSITEILAVLGVEAARKMLLREIRAVISFDGSYVNYRHLAILCDVMTQRGGLMPITRNGINRVEKGCIAKCSFEETVEILMQAACFGEVDYLRGVTENVLVGQLASFGTGICDVLADDAKLKDPSTHFDTPMTDIGGGTGGSGGGVSGLDGVMSPQSTLGEFSASPFSPFSPVMQSPSMIMSPSAQQQFSPSSPQNMTSPLQSIFSPTQQAFNISSPTMMTSPTAGFLMSPSSPSPLSPSGGAYSPTSPNIASPTYSPTSPTIASPSYSPTSPIYSPTSPMSPTYSPTSPMSPMYSPTSPTFASGAGGSMSPSMMMSPGGLMSPTMMSPLANPTSPNFSRAVSSPVYSPSSPVFGMAAQNPQSPGAYSPTAQIYSPIGLITSPSAEPVAPLSPSALQSPRYDPMFSAGPPR